MYHSNIIKHQCQIYLLHPRWNAKIYCTISISLNTICTISIKSILLNIICTIVKYTICRPTEMPTHFVPFQYCWTLFVPFQPYVHNKDNAHMYQRWSSVYQSFAIALDLSKMQQFWCFAAELTQDTFYPTILHLSLFLRAI